MDWEKITGKKRSPDPKDIITETQSWWTGIEKKEIRFVQGLDLTADYIPAYIPGHLIIVSGYTSAGKSQYLSQLTFWTAGVQHVPTLVFSLEDSRMERLMSLVSCMTDIHRKPMILGKVHDRNSERIKYALKDIESWPLWIYDDVFYFHEMRSLIEKHKPKIIIMDYVQKLRYEGKIFDRMSQAAGDIYICGQEVGATWLVGSQVPVDDAKNENEHVIRLKGAGDLAEAAHSVVQLKKSRRQEDGHQVQIQIKKNKVFGKTGKIDARFNETWTKIVRDGFDAIAHVED